MKEERGEIFEQMVKLSDYTFPEESEECFNAIGHGDLRAF